MSLLSELQDQTRETLEFFREQRDRGALSAVGAGAIADQTTHRFMTARGSEYLRDAVTLIAEMSAAADPAVRRVAVQSLFQRLIEPLNDAFDPESADLADRIMAQLIAFHRLREPLFDRALCRFGELTETDLLERRLRAVRQRSGVDPRRLKRVLILSRVTIGADVAVASVIINHLRCFSPRAEIVLVGGVKLRDLFGGDPGLRFNDVEYERGGELADRLAAWTRLVEVVKAETNGLDADEFLVIDPDSRMTQLGLLPLTAHEDRYALFDSRRFSGTLREALGDATARWAAMHWPVEAAPARPFVAPLETSVATGSAVVTWLRGSQKRSVAFLSLGVGGNESKRVSDAFEDLLVRRLADQTVLIIDQGASETEREQVARLMRALAGDGRSIVEAGDGAFQHVIDEQADVVIWQGGIGSFAGLVAASDFYVGYDSAGQHIAAALGRPALTVFVNGSTLRFAERWRPTGSTRSRVLSLTPQDVSREPIENLVNRALALIGEFSVSSL